VDRSFLRITADPRNHITNQHEAVPSPLATSFEELYGTFMLFGRFACVEGPQVLPLAGLGVFFSGIKSILAGFKLSNHEPPPIGLALGMFQDSDEEEAFLSSKSHVCL
jgi:hypothetical protein